MIIHYNNDIVNTLFGNFLPDWEGAFQPSLFCSILEVAAITKPLSCLASILIRAYVFTYTPIIPYIVWVCQYLFGKFATIFKKIIY